MESFIIYALVLALVQIWLIPTTLNLHNLQWQFSDRSEDIERSDMLKRALRASDNLKETLPAFLALVLLAMVLEKDVSNLACWAIECSQGQGVCYL
ncbi:MAG: MAPEG family protein, partial [Proteobacteria bacterium]|nr:MAPEG family protein [Pseudomonadota bacterium]